MKLSNVAFTGSINISGSLVLPNGPANLRPSNALTGSLFVETSASGSNLLVYNGQSGSGWEIAGIQTEPQLYIPPPSGDIEYLVVAGGASGGSNGGGGGAGGLLSSSLSSIASGSSITVTVGAGGSNSVSYQDRGNDGSNSTLASAAGTSFTTVTSIGGGGGASNDSPTGRDGGSGGGAGTTPSGGGHSGGSGTAGQGNRGGNTSANGHPYVGAGGGGAGAQGTDVSTTPGAGGAGKQSSITGTSTYYAGGGGGTGGTQGATGGAGGSGGGGQGGVGSSGQAGFAADVNTGGGGGSSGDAGAVGAGGSGIVILAYDSGSITATGGVAKSRSDGHVYHTFNSSGTLSVGGPSDGSVLNGDNFGAITYVGDRPTNAGKTGMGFNPDLIIIKGRSFSDHWSVLDSTRGANVLGTNSSDAQSSFSGFTFDSDGFTVGSSGQANSNGETHIAWGWKATGGTTTSNGVGSITSTLQANTAAGFSIGTYTGNSTAGATIGHGLSSAPELLIVKSLNTIGGSSKAWTVYAEPLGNTKNLYLNNSSAASTYNFWNNTSPTDTVFSVSSDTNVNSSSGNYVFYAFHSVSGYQKIGSYSGTGSSLEITVGFQPRFVVIRRYASSGDRWLVVDSFRGGNTNNDSFLDFQDTLSERDMNATNGLTFNSNSFTINTTDGALNNSAGTYLYWAIA